MNVDDAWKSTCKVLLGAEIGELAEYEGYLAKYAPPLRTAESALSGKEVTVSHNGLCESAKLIRGDETSQWLSGAGKMKLDLDSIKDLDSIVEALGERVCYSGNSVLGKSQAVEKSDKCGDSSFVYASQNIQLGSRYVAYSSDLRVCEYAFGMQQGGQCKFVINCFSGYRDTRCMEILRTFDSSDCYYSANLEGCSNCMFSFNQRNKSFLIGNLQLPKDQYLALKAKLVEEIRQALGSRKTVPAIMEIVRKGSGKAGAQPGRKPAAQPAVEKAFSFTSELLLGKPLKDVVSYGDWLKENVGWVTTVKSARSGMDVYVPYLKHFMEAGDNLLTLDESLEHGKNHISEAQARGLSLSDASQTLESVKATTSEVVYGSPSIDVKECACYADAMHVFQCSLAYFQKDAAYCHWARNTENAFGCAQVLQSACCMKCYDSVNLTRCFELDGCINCSDSYFCHNCEGLQNCMFCFNAKSLRYAIGNVEVGKEGYSKVRKIVMDSIAKRLEKEKRLGTSIYNVGCHGRE